MPKPLIYLASPHTHQDKKVREQRWNDVVEMAAFLMVNGNHVYCPIAHTHHIALTMDKMFGDKKQFDFGFWEEYDYRMISLCDLVIVLRLDGWRDSKGVTAEMKYARDNNIPIIFMDAYHG